MVLNKENIKKNQSKYFENINNSNLKINKKKHFLHKLSRI